MPDTLQGLCPPPVIPYFSFGRTKEGGGEGMGGRFIPLWSSDPQCSDYHKTQSRLGFAARRKISLSLWNFNFRHYIERRKCPNCSHFLFRKQFVLRFVSRKRSVSWKLFGVSWKLFCFSWKLFRFSWNRFRVSWFVKTVSCFVKTVSCFVKTVKQRRYPWSYGQLPLELRGRTLLKKYLLKNYKNF